jgi:putative MATE family efflux protein
MPLRHNAVLDFRRTAVQTGGGEAAEAMADSGDTGTETKTAAAARPESKRQRLQRISRLAWPIVAGMVSQNILNLVDVAFVGRLGPAALAAVGVGSFAFMMMSTFFVGIASGGVQAMSARRMGEGRGEVAAVPLNAGLLFAASFGVPATVVLVAVTPYVFPLLNGDPEVVADGIPYMQARMLAVAFVAANFSFRGYWNGVDRSALYMRTLVVMQAVNIILDWILIFGHFGAPALGTAGAGIASTAATVTGSAYYFVLGRRHALGRGFLHGLPDRRTLGTMLSLGVPTAFQQFFFFGGFTVLFWIVGRIGTSEVAAATVLINVTLLAIFPAIGLGLSSATLVGNSLGRERVSEARGWGRDVAVLAWATTSIVALPMIFAPRFLLSVFVADPATVELACTPLRIVGVSLYFDVVGIVFSNSLLGAGASRRVFLVSTGFQWVFGLPLIWLAGPATGGGLTAVWCAVAAWRVAQAVAFTLIWGGSSWTRHEV